MILQPVLVRPMYAGNIGSAARVAANFGVKRLLLVSPECVLEAEPDFVRMAMGAERLIEVAVVHSVEEAVAGCDVVLATTSGRQRDPRWIGPPAAAFGRAADAGAERVAVLFGPERRGLGREELRRAHMLLTIPSNPSFPVLNLAQAVAIVIAAFAEGRFTPSQVSDPLDAPAPATEFDAAIAHLREALLETGFLDRANPSRVADQIRLLLGRAVPTRRELAIVRGVAAHLLYLWRRG